MVLGAAACWGVVAAPPLSAQSGESALPFGVCDRLTADASTDLGGPAEELLRLAELSGEIPRLARGMRRGSDDLAIGSCRGGPAPEAPSYRLGFLRILPAPVQLSAWSNSGYPDDRNNGAVWAGRGFSGQVSAGVRLEAGPVSAGFAPVATYQANRDFTIRPANRPGISEFANALYSGIDLPQRFGDEAYDEVHTGQSYVRLDFANLAAGISYENLWVGPAVRDPILMSSTAPGFRHVFLGTSKPLDLWIARVDAEMILGRLRESDHFDQNPENDENRLAMWVLTVSPRWLDGLELGFARSYMYEASGAENLSVLFRPSERNLAGNELASVFARWLLVESQAEVYLEWARDDRYATVEDDLIPEPDHSQAYMLGFQKLTRAGTTVLGPTSLRFQAEAVHLQEKQEYRTGRPLPVYYTHSAIRQGYTHRGQLLGAAVGPGGDGQFFALDGVFTRGMVGIFAERVRRNDGSQEAVRARFAYPYAHDTELGGGVRGLAYWRDLLVSGSLGYASRWDRDFLEDDSSVKLNLNVQWWPSTR